MSDERKGRRHEGPLAQKSFGLAVAVVRLARRLAEQQREYVLSKQLLRSGTAPGALVREADYAESKKDFVHKLAIALKEANETRYWLDLLRTSGYLATEDYVEVHQLTEEVIRLLTSIIATTKRRYLNK